MAIFHREKQSVSSSDLLQALADCSEIKLTGCTVTGVLDIIRLFDPAEKFQTDALITDQGPDRKTITLPQAILFDQCIFEENVVFSGPWAQPESTSVIFKSDVIFNSSTFKGQARFRNAVFEAVAGFDGCTFEGVVTLKNARIARDAKFRTATFKGYALLGEAVFNSSARFINTHFNKGANFSGAKFLDETDFSGVYCSSRAVPKHDAVFFARHAFGDDESFWRFVKQSAQEAGHYRMAGECFYSEQCASLRHKFRGDDYQSLRGLKKLARIFTGLRLLPELIFGRLLFGYGERPVRVLAAGALIILACAFFYAQQGMLIYRGNGGEASFLQGLYFSMITFTTLGYGDLFPVAEGLCRLVAMVEAVAGGCLMALFVVCLAKRFSRG